ncbi:Nitrogen regulation protein C [Chryseobacterium balustinum]|uniref:Nitrogen regulation protein C n=2 Tax=Chryseobacterium balustinum TaxID=246 RepID=A0AAX2IQA6_9FLAO|nr:Nitrogen regulation protein C [Chryseobacterium balustinum]
MFLHDIYYFIKYKSKKRDLFTETTKKTQKQTNKTKLTALNYIFYEKHTLFFVYLYTKTDLMKPKLTIFGEPMLYTEGLSKLLTQSSLFNTIDLCNSYEALQENLQGKPPEFLMINSNMLMLTDLLKNVENITAQNKTIKIIVIGNSYDIMDIRKLFNKGIKSYLDKNSRYDEFLKSVQALLSNEIYICDYAKEKMINFLNTDEKKQKLHIQDPLTKREMEILKLICDGLSSKDICEKLFISINTVETHRKRILLKLNVKNSVGVVKYAIANHIID